MANLSNINDILRISSSGVGLNKNNTGPSELDIESAGADMVDMTRTGKKTYRFAISGASDFSIFDVGANNDRLIISSDGDATFTGIIGVNGSTNANIPITATTSSGYEDVAYFKSTGTNINSRISLFPTGTGSGAINSTANNLLLQTSGTTALTIDSNQDATFVGSVTATNFIGTLPTGQFLPLTGGTLTGDLVGTNVAIGGAIVANRKLAIYNTNADNELQFIGTDFTNIYSETDSTMAVEVIGDGALKLATKGGNLTIATGGSSTFTGDVSIAEKLMHSGDTNTYLQFPGTNDKIVFATNGNDILTLDAAKTATFAGNVGINSYLTINGVSAGTSTFQEWKNDGTLFAYNGSAAAIISGGSTTDYVAGNTTGATSVILSTNNTARLTINGTGNATFTGSIDVGTGNSVINGDLYFGVNADIFKSSGTLGINATNSTFSGSVTATNFIGTLPTGQFLPLAGGTMNSGAAIGFVVASAGGSFINITHTSREAWSIGARRGAGDDDYLDIGIDGGIRAMSWHETGRIGIGTDEPTAKLDIKGDGADIFLQSNDFKIARIQPRGTGANLDKGLLSLFDGSVEDVRIDTEGSSWFNGGSIGIGTTAPTSKLDISDPVNRVMNASGEGQFEITGSGYTFGIAMGATTTSLYHNSSLRSLSLGTNSSDAITIDGSQRVGIGETDPDTTLHVKNSGSIVLTIERSGDGKAVSFSNGIQEVGDISFTGSNGVTYNSASDYRLKEDLQDFNGLDKISKIKMYDFKWKSSNDRDYGVMAHELQEILPHSVSGEKDGEKMQGVDYSKIVPLLVKSIQEQQKQIKELQDKSCTCNNCNCDK